MSQEDTALWHGRLTHVGEMSLIELFKKRVFSGQDIKKLKFCEKCVLRKSKKLMLKKEYTVQKSLLIMFIQICGRHPGWRLMGVVDTS